MSDSSSTPDSQKNTADHGGVVLSGTFSGPIANATGPGAVATNVSVGAQDPLVEALRDKLAEARRALAGNHDPARAPARGNAIALIDSLDSELADRRKGRDVGKLGKWVNEVFEALSPVAGLIGGAAAVLDIIDHLRAII